MYEFISINDNKSKKANSDYCRTRSIINYALYVDLPNAIKIPRDINIKSNSFNSDYISKYLDAIFDTTFEICKEYIPDFSYMGGSTFDIEEEGEALKGAIKNHCIISALYTCKALYTEKYFNYNLSMVDMLEHCRNLGFFSLLECGNLVSNIDNQGKKKKLFRPQYVISRKDEGYFDGSLLYDDSNSLRTKASIYRKKGGEYEKYFTHHILKDSRVGKNRNGEVQVNYFNSDIFYELIRHGSDADRAITKLLEKDINKQEIDESILEKVNLDGIIGKLYNDIKMNRDSYKNSRGKKNIDDLLFDYQMERYYNHCLIKGIAKELLDTELQWYLNRYPVMIEFLSYTQMLPNAMSRDFIVKKALDILKNEKTLIRDKWGIIVDENIVSYGRVDQLDIKIMRWLEYFKKYCIFASYIAFPIFEKTFFMLMYENIDASKYRSKLEKMTYTLAAYVEKNYKELRNDYGDEVVKRNKKRTEDSVNKSGAIKGCTYKEIYYKLAYHMYKRSDLGELYSRNFNKEYFTLIRDPERETFRKGYLRSKRIELVDEISKKPFIEVQLKLDGE